MDEGTVLVLNELYKLQEKFNNVDGVKTKFKKLRHNTVNIMNIPASDDTDYDFLNINGSGYIKKINFKPVFEFVLIVIIDDKILYEMSSDYKQKVNFYAEPRFTLADLRFQKSCRIKAKHVNLSYYNYSATNLFCEVLYELED